MLTTVQALMLFYAEKYKVNQKEFDRFWQYDFNAYPPNIIRDLILHGYLKIGGVEVSLSNLKTTELKQLLKDNNLKQSGNKDELVKLLIENVDNDILKKVNPEKYYSLTDKGIKAKEKYTPLLEARRLYRGDNKFLDIVKSEIEKNRNFNLTDFRLFYLFPEAEKALNLKDYYEASKIYYSIASILSDKESHEEALVYVLKCCYLRCCGVKEMKEITEYSSLGMNSEPLEWIFPYSKKSAIAVSEYVSNLLKYLINALNLDENALREKTVTIFEDFNVPSKFFTKNELVEIIIAESKDDINFLTELYKNAEKKVRAKFNTEVKSSAVNKKNSSININNKTQKKNTGCFSPSALLIISIIIIIYILIR